MIAWIDDALFSEGKSRTVDLVALLRAAVVGEHALAVTDKKGREGEAPHRDRWVGGLHGKLQHEVKALLEAAKSVDAGVSAHGSFAILVSADWRGRPTDVVVELKDAVRLLQTPLAIVVEHGVNDAMFLLRVLPPDWRKTFLDWLARGLVVFEHGGGAGTMARLVDHHAGKGEPRLSGLEPRAWQGRHFVVGDRDAPPGHLGDNARTLERAFRRVQVAGSTRVCFLERRKQENYLPRQAVEAYVSSRITAKEDREKLLAEVATHFESQERHWSELPCLGGNASFYKLAFAEESQRWSDAWFEADGSRDEFQRLAESINAAR